MNFQNIYVNLLGEEFVGEGNLVTRLMNVHQLNSRNLELIDSVLSLLNHLKD